MLISGDSEVFLHTLRGSRIVWISGPFGSGKTALAYSLALEFIRRKWARHIYSNIPDAVSSSLADIVATAEGMDLDLVLIVDEVGAMVRNQSEALQFAEYMRKFRSVLITASRFRPPRAFTELTVWRKLDFTITGLPLLEWEYNDSSAKRGTTGRKKAAPTTFKQWWPGIVHGVYDTRAIPTYEDTAVAAQFLAWWAERFKSVRAREVGDLPAGFSPSGGMWGHIPTGADVFAAGGPVAGPDLGEWDERLAQLEQTAEVLSLLGDEIQSKDTRPGGLFGGGRQGANHS